MARAGSHASRSARPARGPRAAPSAAAILAELKPLGRESYRKVMLAHGNPEPIWGVSIADMKVISKRVGTDYRLALELFDSGVHDAMYLAGLIADDARMTRKDLARWVSRARGMVAEYTVPWVAAGSPHGRDVARAWIDSAEPVVAAAGWATLCSFVGVTPDAQLDLRELKALMQRVVKTVHGAPNRVRYWMNNFVICVGCSVKPLTADALAAGKAMGKVTVDMGGTACRVPDVAGSIAKVKQRGSLGRKRKSAKC